MRVLDEETWRARAAAHAARVDEFVEPHLARRGSRVKHPVHDFLFTYYSQRPAQLRRWHPGHGVALAGAEEYAGLKGYEWLRDGRCTTSSATGVGTTSSATGGGTTSSATGGGTTSSATGVGTTSSATGGGTTSSATGGGTSSSATGGGAVAVSDEHVVSQRPLLESLRRLLSATAGRTPQFGCFGLHEWAMVYRLSEDETRHADWPLRLGPDGTDAVVESHRIACSHFDAFRFFTEPARSLNVLQPGRDDRAAYEQPGCLHGTMDLYKHAFRLTPMISSDLVADCFELARDVRVLDMRAAPYDLTGLEVDGRPFEPVRIETPEGKAEYAAAQRAFAERAAPLRQRLVDECTRLLIPSTGPAPLV